MNREALEALARELREHPPTNWHYGYCARCALPIASKLASAQSEMSVQTFFGLSLNQYEAIFFYADEHTQEVVPFLLVRPRHVAEVIGKVLAGEIQ